MPRQRLLKDLIRHHKEAGVEKQFLLLRSMLEVMVENLIWAAALFVGEGCFGKDCRDRKAVLSVGIGMYDQRAIERFADAVGPYGIRLNGVAGVNVRSYYSKRWEHTVWTVHHRGSVAEGIADALWPWLENTDKGDQLVRIRAEIATHNEGVDFSTRPGMRAYSDDQVREVRRLAAQGLMYKTIGDQLGMPHNVVSAMARGLYWYGKVSDAQAKAA